jgi:hypothetical protein
MKNWTFYRLLHSRLDEKTGARMTTSELARRIGSSRAHVCQVIANVPGRGIWTRRRLFPHLTQKEVKALGWSEEYNRWRSLKQFREDYEAWATCEPSDSNEPPVMVGFRSTGNIVPSLESGVAA